MFAYLFDQDVELLGFVSIYIFAEFFSVEPPSFIEVTDQDISTTTTVNLNSLGTESVPLDVTQRGIGVGTIHSGSGANLQVGSGGISSEGPLIGSSFDALKHTQYNNKNNYLGAGYISVGNEKPDWFGAGKPKPQMLHGRNFSGAPAGWLDALWLSTYTGGDVKGSNVLLFNKESNGIGYARQNFDSTAWGNYIKIWDSGNDGPGSGLDADLLDGKHASTIINEAINGVKTGGATTGAVSGRGRWFQTGDLLICTQVAFINGYFSAYSLTGSWTYPKAFAEAPFVQVAGGHNGMADNTYRMNGELSAYDVTSTGTSVHYAGGTFASGNSKRVYMLAIGRP